MLLGIHQCRGGREVVWIPTDPWPKLWRLNRRKDLPEDDTSTDVWYLDRYGFYLELPDGLQPKYPDFYRYYRRTQRNPSEASALVSNPVEDIANESPSSDSNDAIDGDRYKADPPENGKERPYWWPSPPERMEREIRDNMGNMGDCAGALPFQGGISTFPMVRTPKSTSCKRFSSPSHSRRRTRNNDSFQRTMCRRPTWRSVSFVGYSEDMRKKHEKHGTTPKLEVTLLSGCVFLQKSFGPRT